MTKPDRAKMTLDEAQDRFEETLDNQTVGDWLTVALQYWQDDMISDDTFAYIVNRIAQWL